MLTVIPEDEEPAFEDVQNSPQIPVNEDYKIIGANFDAQYSTVKINGNTVASTVIDKNTIEVEQSGTGVGSYQIWVENTDGPNRGTSKPKTVKFKSAGVEVGPR